MLDIIGAYLQWKLSGVSRALNEIEARMAEREAIMRTENKATAMPAVRVKPLEWQPVSDGRYASGFRPDEATAGRYRIKRISIGFVIDDGQFSFLGKYFKTIEVAKAAAQKHHERTTLSAIEPAGVETYCEPHPDDLAVDRFAAAMKAKLAQKRAEGRGGWDNPDECSIEWLSELLRSHVEKADPVDVGNFAMMIHQRGGRICK